MVYTLHEQQQLRDPERWYNTSPYSIINRNIYNIYKRNLDANFSEVHAEIFYLLSIKLVVRGFRK